MKSWMRVLGALLLSTAVASCSSDGGSRATTDPASPTSATESETSPEAARVVSVTYKRSGGITGVSEVRRFTLSPAYRGPDRAAVEAIMRAASNPRLATVPMTPLPKNTCCDRFLYVVKIDWDDGTSRTYKTLDGVRQPLVFDRLLHRLP